MVSALNIFDFSASASTDYPAMYQTMKVLFFYFFLLFQRHNGTTILLLNSLYILFFSFHSTHSSTLPLFYRFHYQIVRSERSGSLVMRANTAGSLFLFSRFSISLSLTLSLFSWPPVTISSVETETK